MYLFASFVVFRVMGADYEAAVMTAAFCGFGMGATPNAMANMLTIKNQYGPAPKAFLCPPGGRYVHRLYQLHHPDDLHQFGQLTPLCELREQRARSSEPEERGPLLIL